MNVDSHDHWLVQPETVPIELLYCRQDVIEHWNLSARILQGPYWRLYCPSNDRGTLHYGGRDFQMRSGEVWLIAPETSFSTSAADESLEKFYIHFTAGGDFVNCRDFCLKLPYCAAMAELIGRAGHLLMSKQFEPGVPLLCMAIANLALSMLPEEYRLGKLQPDSALLAVLEYIRKHPLGTPSNGELAAQAKMGISAFCTRFHKHFGLPPQRYITEGRLRQAALLLVKTEYTIDEVAERTGFCDRYYFTRMFKKYRGISPGQFRKNTRESLQIGEAD